MFGQLSGDRRVTLAAFGVCSLIAVGVGAWVCARHGLPARLWGLNLAAWMMGGAAAFVLGRATAAKSGWIVVYGTPLLLAASLAFPGRDGVHRWISAGPVQANIAMLILPMFVVALAATRSGQVKRWLAALACLLVLGLQPDASQATALGLALTVILAPEALPARWRLVGLVAIWGLVAWTWARPDPLEPAPAVEEILRLAAGQSTLLAALGALALAVSCLVPLTTAGSPAGKMAGRALAALLLGAAAGPALGHFPTPLVGLGLSPILGAWLGVGLLCAVMAEGERSLPSAVRTR